MRAPLLCRTLVLPLLALAACGPKAAVVQLDAPTDAATVALLAPFEGDQVQPAPDRVARRLDKVLAARNLTARPVDVTGQSGPLSRAQTTEQRLAWLVEQADGAPFVVLLETSAVYTTQIEGRFRWSVEVSSTIARVDDPTGASTRDFKVPVFLQFVHEKEAAAVAEAGVVIERQVSRQLDQWLGGLPVGSAQSSFGAGIVPQLGPARPTPLSEEDAETEGGAPAPAEPPAPAPSEPAPDEG